MKVSENDYAKYLQYRISLQNETTQFMESQGIDLWISPSTISLPQKGLSSTGSPLMNLPWTFIGFPTISLPFGKSDFNLPIGLQFTGKLFGLKALFDNLAKMLSATH